MSADDKVSALLRGLPKVDDVLKRPEIIHSGLSRWALVRATRACIEDRRRLLQHAFASGPPGRDAHAGEPTASGVEVLSAEVASDLVIARAQELCRPSLRRVINATGVVLHTNFGRAPLGEAALARVSEVARGYSNLEYDVAERARGSRHTHVQSLLADLTGAEASVVVNNNAAAVLVGLAALAAGGEVVVSRGELVEIGGSFRIPDVMRWSGARLVEVGTTNKTHARDYEGALVPTTSLLLKVHRSNFAVVGFVADVAIDELCRIGRAARVPVMVDLGSGSLERLQDFPGVDLPAEPTVPDVVASGVDLVTFSGDKLLGGPQAGVLVGTRQAVERVKTHPLMRVVRPGKMTLAALEATLEAYRSERARTDVPVLRMLGQTRAELAARAQRLLSLLGVSSGSLALDVVETTSAVGGGALPLCEPVSFAVRVCAQDGRSARDLDEALCRQRPAIVGRIADDRLLLDVRTIGDDDFQVVVAALGSLARA